MNTFLEQQLTDTLDRRADQVDRGTGDQPLRFADVRTRATRIRRRRRVANGVAIAAAAAMIVPVGVMGINGLDRSQSPPVAELVPEPIDQPITLTTDVEQGPAPEVAWIDASEVRLPDGTRFTVQEEYQSVHLVAGRTLVRRIDPDTGIAQLDELGADGQVLSSSPVGDEIVVTADGSAAAWLDHEFQLHVLDDEGFRDTGLELPRISLSLLEGGDGCRADCTVWWYGHGARGGPGRTELDTGQTEDMQEYGAVLDVHRSGLLTGITSTDELEPGSCSTVRQDGTPLWDTCDHTVERFSPDGRWVMGSDAYQDGAGQGTVSVLDAATGDRLVTFDSGDGFVTSRLWEDDSHLLVAHHSYADQTWQVFRVGLDGSVELAVPPREAWDTEPPFRLPS